MDKRKYADQKNPNGKYKEGTIIKITGQDIKRDNGLFRINGMFPRQNSNDSYFQYTRILKNGELSKASGTGLRGAWGSTLDKIAKIVDNPPTKKKTKKRLRM